ncbi:MAG: hypothetical protein ABR574_01330 [Cryomorphaceae bacterium]
MSKIPVGERTVSFKYIALFVAPIILALLVGYFYLRSLNRALETQMAQTEQTLGALEGEVYRLKQALSQRDAKMKYVLDGNLKRFKVSAGGDEFIWLFFRESDGNWYAEVESATPLTDGLNYKLVVGDKVVGEFNLIADVVGLQKIGSSPIKTPISIYAGPRGETALNSDWKLLYDASSPDF